MRSGRVLGGLSEPIKQHTALADPGYFESLLRHCGEAEELSLGRHVHAHMIEIGYDKNAFFANLLVQMYGKCGAVPDAYWTFFALQNKDVYSWTFMIGTYAQLGWRKDAMSVFQQMQRDEVAPSAYTFIYLLSACTDRGALFEGRHAHTYILSSGFERDGAIATALVCMYSKCGSIDDALQVFYTSPERDTISWNAIISMASGHGYDEDAYYLCQQMQVEGFSPSKGTLVSCLNACSNCPVLSRVKRIHTLAISCEYDLDTIIANALVTMYGKCSSLKDAHAVFGRMPARNVISWTALIAAYAECSKDVIQILQRMLSEGFMPDKVTLASSLTSCINEASLPDGQWLHSFICDSGFDSDGVIGTALLDMYGKCGRMEDACRIFKKLPKRDVVCWNAMIAVCAQHGHGKGALDLLRRMGAVNLVPNKVTFISILDACANEAALEEGKLLHACLMQYEFQSEHIIGNALVNFYGKCGSLADAHRLFWKLPKRSISSWTAIITAYSQQGWARESLLLCHQMRQNGVAPNEITFISMLSSCSHAGLMGEAWETLYVMQQECLLMVRPEHFDCLVDLMGRAGLLMQVRVLIDNMPFHPGANTWIAFLGSCKLHNNSNQVTDSAQHALEVDSATAAPYVLLSNICTMIDSDEDSVLMTREEEPGQLWDCGLVWAHRLTCMEGSVLLQVVQH